MKVSLMVIALNEEKTLPSLLADIRAQTYPHDKMEIILVDSMSNDGTKPLMKRFARESDFAAVKVLANPEKRLANGWNVGIRAATGDVLMRVDAHADIPEDFVARSVACIESGEDACGGPRPNVLFEKSDFGEMLLEAESSAFGSSIANYRTNEEKRYVDSIFHGCYRREIFETIGLLDEQLGRTEDNEIHYRMRRAGFKICMDPKIRSYQHVRPTLKRMLKQKYGNGYWCGLTLGVCPGCLKLYHFVPGVTVLAFAGSAALLPIVKWPAVAVYGGYMAMNLLMTGLSILRSKKRNRYFALLPAVFAGIHVSYGIGNIVGLAKMPFWRKKYYQAHKVPRIKTRLAE
ncbi:MAG: glycosyltransferase family 2 protein [Eubacteriales bacterium]|nr:glycosyltransferase family 2 protein [Eubacteriales bacterium]